MPDSTIDNRMLLRRTLTMMGAMVGACVVLVGTLTLVASTVVGRAVSPTTSETSDRDHRATSAPASSAGVVSAPPAKRAN